MQASIRRLLCTKIIYLSAVNRLQNEAATNIQTFFRSLAFRRKLRELRGLAFLAVRAKFIAFILAHAQVRLAKHVRGFLVRKMHPYETMRIAVVRAEGRTKQRRRIAATKIRSQWKMYIVRQQFLFVRRVTTSLQIVLRTSLARRGYIGPRLPVPQIR